MDWGFLTIHNTFSLEWNSKPWGFLTIHSVFSVEWNSKPWGFSCHPSCVLRQCLRTLAGSREGTSSSPKSSTSYCSLMQNITQPDRFWQRTVGSDWRIRPLAKLSLAWNGTKCSHALRNISPWNMPRRVEKHTAKQSTRIWSGVQNNWRAPIISEPFFGMFAALIFFWGGVVHHFWLWFFRAFRKCNDAQEFLRLVHEIPKGSVGTVSQMAGVKDPNEK